MRLFSACMIPPPGTEGGTTAASLALVRRMPDRPSNVSEEAFMSHRALPAAVLVLLMGTSQVARAANLKAGKLVYERNCRACHGASGAGDGPAARALRPAPTAFNTTAYWSRTKDGDVKAAIRKGRPGTSMMAFESLSDEQLVDIVAYLRTLATAE